MKICLVVNAGSLHIQRWVKYLIDKGHEVHVISPGNYKIEGAIVHNLITISKLNFIINPIQTKRIINKIKPDVVHAHYLTNCGFYAALSEFHPFVVTAMGCDALCGISDCKKYCRAYNKYKSCISNKIIKFVIKRADVIHSVSNQITETLIYLGADKEKIVTFPRGIKMDKFNFNDREGIKKKLNFENNSIVISTRNFRPEYNIELLIEAIPHVIQKRDKVRFIIAGMGKQEGYLKKLVEELNVKDYVEFIGHLSLDELPEYLEASDVYVSTSLSDGAPNSTFEAMACGSFPVVTDIPANRPWITSGLNGFLVPFDSKLLAQSILEALQNNGLRERAKIINRDIVKENCDSDTNLEKIEKIYYELIIKYKNKK